MHTLIRPDFPDSSSIRPDFLAAIEASTEPDEIYRAAGSFYPISDD